MLKHIFVAATLWLSLATASGERGSPLSLSVEETRPPLSNQASLSEELQLVVSSFIATEPEEKALAHQFQNRISNLSVTLDALSSASNVTGSPQKAVVACIISSYLFPGAAITQEPEYTQEREAHWSQTCWLPAACFIRPKNTLEVAATMKVITHLGVRFAVRGGGHNANSGFASVGDNGVLIDMQDLNRLEVQGGADGNLITGPGNRWSRVYEYLSTNYGRAVVGGRTGEVGVPGFLLGGGMFFFPNMHGLGADNVVNFKCVLANSTVVNANQTSHTELFKSLKGGAANFAIVTEFTLRTYPIRDVWYAIDFYANADYKAVLNATIQTQLAMEKDPRIGFHANVQPGGILVGKVYASVDGQAVNPSSFAAFDGIKPMTVLVPPTNGTLADIASSLGPIVAVRREPHVVSYELSLDLYTDVYERYRSILNSSSAPSANLSYTIQPMGSAAVAAGKMQGGNIMGIPQVPQSWHASLVEWSSLDDDQAAHDMLQTYGADVKSLAEARNVYLPYQFMNDASYTQNPLETYTAENLAIMQDVSSAYDPAGIFQRLQNGGFLLRNVRRRTPARSVHHKRFLHHKRH
ncbi:FAD-binding domain-containing protein [Aaosphaeria arxii CBS 175.79]|uniref:FAD-binding domain-containing protein n=1 Tax=Aaosphaeria arxii CBS 175.79 TaxID=1450172 RepID=A0A6A5Y0D0_9PLEO|nr:FAD-binding domain-containing protein [Aaosphaeria arxii CBS 175.79]KAF2018537.1 FAD-binding domain-containing protein [Aaosphaeria arxii CBS 175.79]